jgi:tRNA(Ile)-lysidine synthase
MLKGGKTAVVAVSGGPDSMVLLHLLMEIAPSLRVKLHVAHLHHGLRGRDADLDLKLVRDYCRKSRLPFISKRVDVRAIAEGKRISLETAARMARYEFLIRCARRVGSTAIAVGHTADDQVETFLMRLLRGAGGRGLGGMQPVRRSGDFVIVRPLLRTWRQDILSFAEACGLNYRIDRSNMDVSFLRNRVRHRLIARIQREYSPRIKETLRRSADILGNEHAFVHDEANKILRRIGKPQSDRIAISVPRLLALPPAIRAELLRIAVGELSQGASPGYSDVDALLDLCKGERGKKQHQLPGSVTALREYDKLILSSGAKMQAGDYEFPLSDGLEIATHPFILQFGFSILSRAEIRRLRKKPVKLAEIWGDGKKRHWPLREFFSLDALADKGIVVRNRRPGDRFTPLGMRGTKKLKGIMIDEKLPSHLRAAVPLIACGDEIIWLPGHRIAERYKITPSTQRVAQVSVERVGEMW